MKLSAEKISLIRFLVGDYEQLLNAKNVPALRVFDDRVVSFFDAVSKQLLSEKENKKYSDIISWAFWIRRTSLSSEKQRYEGKCKIGRGVAFHIAPSNVPVNFAVSLTSALLAGNACVVRVSSKDFAQTNIICNAFCKVLDKDEFSFLKPYLTIVRYERDKDINDYMSSICDIRIVWGGNRTIADLRRSELPPRAIELAFADRHSIAIINADEYLKKISLDASAEKKIAEMFYIDTFFSDQNACSSPRLVVWLGSEKKLAQNKFFAALADVVNEKYEFSPILAIDKLNAFCELAIDVPGVNARRVLGSKTSNAIVRIKIDSLVSSIFDYKMGGGYFFEYDCDLLSLDEIAPALSKSCQTVSYLGIEPEAVQDIVYAHGVRGVDRIVPIGHTMDLGFYWDGYDMIDAMSRHLQTIPVLR